VCIAPPEAISDDADAGHRTKSVPCVGGWCFARAGHFPSLAKACEVPRPMASLKTTSLDGRWEFVAASWPTPPERLVYSRMEWLEASVPGHVHRDLHACHIIADPLTQKHELGSQWI